MRGVIGSTTVSSALGSPRREQRICKLTKEPRFAQAARTKRLDTLSGRDIDSSSTNDVHQEGTSLYTPLRRKLDRFRLSLLGRIADGSVLPTYLRVVPEWTAQETQVVFPRQMGNCRSLAHLGAGGRWNTRILLAWLGAMAQYCSLLRADVLVNKKEGAC